MLAWLKRKWAAIKARFQRKTTYIASPSGAVEVRKPLITKRRIVQAIYFPASVAATSYALWMFLPAWLAGLLMAVILTHEFAHYFTASRLGRVALLPFFVPVPFFGVLGATHVKGHEAETDRKIALAGPFAATMLVAGLMLAFSIVGFMPGFWASFWMLVFQIYSGVFGGDGRRYRRATNAIKLASQPLVAEPAFV